MGIKQTQTYTFKSNGKTRIHAAASKGQSNYSASETKQNVINVLLKGHQCLLTAFELCTAATTQCIKGISSHHRTILISAHTIELY
jgi:hypothetical protein